MKSNLQPPKRDKLVEDLARNLSDVCNRKVKKEGITRQSLVINLGASLQRYAIARGARSKFRSGIPGTLQRFLAV